MREENLLELRTRTVRRCLWKVDHERLRNDLDKERAEMQDELKTRYNFDFDRSVALKGSYEWEPTQPLPPSRLRKRKPKSSKSQSKSASKPNKGPRRGQQQKRDSESQGQSSSSTHTLTNIRRRPQDQQTKNEPSSPTKKKSK